MVGFGRISNSSKLLCMSSLPTSMKGISWKTAEEKWQHHFSHYKAMGIFFRRSKAANSPDGGQIWSDLVEFRTPPSSHACQRYQQVWKGSDEKQPRKSGNTVFIFITLTVAIETRGLIWSNFKLTKAFMYVTNTCKYEKDRIKNSWEKVATPFFHHKSTEIYSGAQGQLTLQSVVWSGRISKSFELSCMSSLPARMKRIGWKTAEKKWQHRFSHYSTMAAICCHGKHRVLIRSCSKPNAAFSLPQWSFL